ncbi:unnamed protein product [Caenorhabditis sp. 36 PRJEB53466]|nr:unnamed protein product [Caenorhabditis sp. 36 PRJEB53466]
MVEGGPSETLKRRRRRRSAPRRMNDNFDGDVPMADPFLSLVTKLDDIDTFPSNDSMDFDMENWQEAGPSHANDASGNPNQHSPPQEFYDGDGQRDVSTLHSLLNNQSDDYYGMRFSPPNFDNIASSRSVSSLASNQPLSDGPASMLSALSTASNNGNFPADAYRPLSLAQQLAAPAMSTTGAPLYVNTNGIDQKNIHAMLSPPHHHSITPQRQSQSFAEPMEHINGYMSPFDPGSSHPTYPHYLNQSRIVAPRSEHPEPIGSPSDEVEEVKPPKISKSARAPAAPTPAPGPESPPPATNMKEELLRLLVNMSPSDVERLKNKRAGGGAEKKYKAQKVIVEQDPEDDEDDDDSDSGEPHQTSNIIVRRPKTERRTAHNLIEKKYRCSINDRIQQLKVLLCGDEAKLSKSATLRRAIEHIEEIEQENSTLKFQLDHLRKQLQMNGIPVQYPEMPFMDYSVTSPNDSSPSPPRNERKRSRMSTTPMRSMSGKEASRVTLFAMLMAVLIFNPIGLLAGSASFSQVSAGSKPPVASPYDHGRVIDDADGTITQPMYWHNNIIKPSFSWIINIGIFFFVLVKLLVYGEPVQDFTSLAWQTFVATREKARAELSTGNLKEAQRQFCECLVVLERTLPSPGIPTIFSIVWECIRHLLNWLWIGRYISRRKRSTTMPVSVVCRSHAQTAVLYHEIHQIHLMGITDYNDDSDEPSTMSGLYLALSAVNLAEAAGASNDGLPRVIMAQIYLAASIRCRLALPNLLAPFFSGYFLRRARRHVRRAPEHSVSHLLWLFHPATRKYMADTKRLEHILSAKQKLRFGTFVEEEHLSPLSRIRTTFKVYLLSKLVQELVGGEEIFTKNVERILNDNDRLDDDVDVVDVSRLLVSISTQCAAVLTNEKDESAKFGSWLSRNGDASCTWWTHVLTCGIYFRNNKTELARQHFSLIRNGTPEIFKDNLGMAVGHALCTRKFCLDDRDSPKLSQYVCLHTRQALKCLRIFSTSRTSGVVSGIQEGARRMAYEWVMSSLLDAWRSNITTSTPYWTQAFRAQPTFSTLYQEAYNHYAILHGRRGDCWRLFVYELTCRMLNGANPQATWSGIRRVRSTKMDAVRGRVSMRRSAQPDAFHLHTLLKLHTSME